MRFLKKVFSKVIIKIVRFYQIIISPFLGNNCRFYPSCSQYMILAVKKHGIIKGLYFGIKRIFKCNPWHNGGIDFP